MLKEISAILVCQIPKEKLGKISEILSETGSNTELRQCVQNNEPLLNQEQPIYQKIFDDISNNNGGIFFLDAPEGTGKTFVTKFLLSSVRRQRKVASSEIATTLLPGGRTEPLNFYWI